ncbi:fumarylacetoacetate hydrolase [Rhodoblastus sphagnicola]|uniref:Fumarylacetoacetate hydrolase n=1 Tax=Rhodoblastus sphagnicola TaxID=333368 RepID=A0A2S6NBC4_9HYPH|nr:fumarylpyruvate hydrolase [Rhodoblastus sphagnicola]PPQ31913.1 fumarylacetoacetate hydrolase [Rhodoblastus sphagnicola]
MNTYVIDPPPQACAPVAGGGLFPVRRIFCVGQNYADHAREMGGDPNRNPPFFFSKPADALVVNGADAPYPSLTDNLHHEIELVVALARGASNIAAGAAEETIFGYAAGIDLTRRDLQAEAKKAGRPWDMAKGFDASAPVGLIRPLSQTGRINRGRISLSLNGAPRQDGDLADMIWSIPDIIAILSTYVSLAPGDLIFTGTPAGVGPALSGDVLRGEIEGVGEVTTRIV